MNCWTSTCYSVVNDSISQRNYLLPTTDTHYILSQNSNKSKIKIKMRHWGSYALWQVVGRHLLSKNSQFYDFICHSTVEVIHSVIPVDAVTRFIDTEWIKGWIDLSNASEKLAQGSDAKIWHGICTRGMRGNGILLWPLFPFPYSPIPITVHLGFHFPMSNFRIPTHSQTRFPTSARTSSIP